MGLSAFSGNLLIRDDSNSYGNNDTNDFMSYSVTDTADFLFYSHEKAVRSMPEEIIEDFSD